MAKKDKPKREAAVPAEGKGFKPANDWRGRHAVIERARAERNSVHRPAAATE
jgi:hypothetical protein